MKTIKTIVINNDICVVDGSTGSVTIDVTNKKVKDLLTYALTLIPDEPLELVSVINYDVTKDIFALVGNKGTVKPCTLSDLTEDEKIIAEQLRTLCESKVLTPMLSVKYVYLSNIITVIGTNSNFESEVSILLDDEKLLINAFAEICIRLLNN